MKLTCIMCPVGCELTVVKNDNGIDVSGFGCIRGKRYAETEITSPSRMITALVKTKQGVASVKTTNLVPKDKIFDVLNQISALHVDDAKFGEVLIENVCGIKDVDVVVTREPV